MRMQRAVAERRERVEHVVGGERAGHAMIEQPMRGRDAARHVVLVLAPHQEQVGRRQHRDGDPGVGQLRRPISSRRE